MQVNSNISYDNCAELLWLWRELIAQFGSLLHYLIFYSSTNVFSDQQLFRNL